MTEQGNIPGLGVLGRLGEKVIGWIALALLILLGYGVYRMGPDGRGAVLNATGNTIFWLVLVAALPWMARLGIKRLVEIGENWVGLVLIATFTLIDLIVGLVLLGGWPTGMWGWLVSIAVMGIAATYNYLVCEYIAERYGGL